MIIIMTLFPLIVISFIVGKLGKNRKFGFWGYFLSSIVLTPLVGLLLVLASDPRPKKL